MTNINDLCELELKCFTVIFTARPQDGDIVKSYTALVIRRILQLDIPRLCAARAVESLNGYYSIQSKSLKWYPQEEGL